MKPVVIKGQHGLFQCHSSKETHGATAQDSKSLHVIHTLELNVTQAAQLDVYRQCPQLRGNNSKN